MGFFIVSPLAATILGTANDDVLAATAADQLVNGLGGDDRIDSRFVRTTLVGGDGDDTLTTTIDRNRPASHTATAEQIAGAGADRLVMSITARSDGFSADGTISALGFQRGDAGDDTITGTAFVDMDESEAVARNTVRGEGGRDVITVLARIEGSPFQSLAENVVNGGADADVITATADGDFDGLVSDARNLIVGGGGSDRIVARAIVESNSSREARNEIDGAKGDDNIRAETRLNANAGVTASVNRLIGAEGNDTLFASGFVDEFSGGDFETSLSGGSGDDILTAECFGAAIGDFYGFAAATTLSGGDGEDVMTATVTADYANTFSLFGEVVVATEMLGGRHDDTMSATADVATGGARGVVGHVLNGESGADNISSSISVVVDGADASGHARALGGDGGDVISLETSTEAGGLVFSANFADGGAGNDVIDVTARAAIFSAGVVSARNAVLGGAGDDVITAIAEVFFDEVDGDEGPEGPIFTAINELEGGAGDDRLSAEIRVTGHMRGPGSGTNRLFGGDGADWLHAEGGDGSVMDGGRNADTLVAGGADDTMRGGQGPDTFVFVFGEAQGDDVIEDFDGSADSLGFVNAPDQGPPGLIDDLDAVSSVFDAGPDGDVVVTFDFGTTLTFVGLGTGAVMSIADLVDDPSTQIF
jgi:Ca2+-binding RTX toxin-like protein